MNSSLERLASDIYPEDIQSGVIRFHVFDRASISDQFQDSKWVIAHQAFDGTSIPCLTSSNLCYDPKSAHGKKLITGDVTANIPIIWNRPSIQEILKELPVFISEREHYELLLTFEPSLSGQLIEVFDERGIAIAIIGGQKDKTSMTLSFEAMLTDPDDEDYYDSFKQCVELWGSLHDYIAHAGETNGMPLRFIDGDTQHEIYVGGTRPDITTTEMDLAELLEEHTRFASDIPTPKIGDIDFQAIDSLTEDMDRRLIQNAIKHLIAAKRIFYRHSNIKNPISHEELVNELRRQQLHRHQ